MAIRSLVPTIYDVARRAGVSANTVSRALNAKPGVAEATRRRIASIAEELRYYPHLGARSMRSPVATTIGMVFTSSPNVVPVSRNFFLYLCAEFYRIYGVRGDRLCVDLNPCGNGLNRDYARSVWQKLCGACIFVGPLSLDDRIIPRVHQSRIPYVALSRLASLPECSCATVDFEEGARQCVARLAARGHQRIGLIKTLSGYQPGFERERGYLRGLEDATLPRDERLIQITSFDKEQLAAAVHRLLNDTTVTALIDASGIEDAEAIRRGAHRAGRKPGKGFELISWTYSPEHAVSDDAVAHLFLPVREAASEGLEQLAAWISGERSEPIHVVFKPALLDTASLSPELPGDLAKKLHLFDQSL